MRFAGLSRVARSQAVKTNSLLSSTCVPLINRLIYRTMIIVVTTLTKCTISSRNLFRRRFFRLLLWRFSGCRYRIACSGKSLIYSDRDSYSSCFESVRKRFLDELAKVRDRPLQVLSLRSAHLLYGLKGQLRLDCCYDIGMIYIVPQSCELAKN